MPVYKFVPFIDPTSGFPFRPKGFGLKELDARNPYAYYTKDDLLGFYADQKDLLKMENTYLAMSIMPYWKLLWKR
ncbi:MAG: hypothetical protein R2769_10770 [Saprospiraceae bacterium]